MVRELAAGETRFPVLHSLEIGETARRKVMTTDLFLRPVSPFRPRGARKPDIVYRFITDVAFPIMENVRLTDGRVTLANGQVREIPPLNSGTAKQWASLVAEWFGPLLIHDAEQPVDPERPRHPESQYAHDLASSERKMAAKWRKLSERISELIGRRIAVPPESAVAWILELAKNKQLPSVEATEAQKRIERFAEKKPTRRDLVRGLKENIETRLAFMLPK